MRAEMMELIGTFFLVLVIALTGDPLSIGIGLAALVYIGGHVSGAHYNPAVTLAVWMRGKLPATKILNYVIAQLLGAFLGAVVAFALTGNSFVAAPAAGVALWEAMLVEILFTFLLASVILVVATGKQLEGNAIYGLAIGLALFVGASAGGAISGGAYNPAVGISPMLFHSAIHGATVWMNALLYLVGPLIGGALAALLFSFTQPKGKKSA